MVLEYGSWSDVIEEEKRKGPMGEFSLIAKRTGATLRQFDDREQVLGLATKTLKELQNDVEREGKRNE